MKKVIFIFVCSIIIAVCMFLERANAYTFDGELDPKNIFSYQVVEMESIGGNRVLATLKNDVEPKFLIACMTNFNGRISILAYAYYDAEFNFRHYLIQGGHYAEILPDETTTRLLKKKLNLLHGLSKAEVDDGKKRTEATKETSPSAEKTL